jgi:hypothetical protein
MKASHRADASGATVGPPPGMIAAAALRDPEAAWSRLQHGAGGVMALLPPRLGDLACAALGLDTNLGALVDGHATAYAVVVQRATEAGAGDVGWAAAIPLADDGARRLAAMPSSALPAGVVEHAAAGLRILTRPGAPLPVAVAISNRWIVVARDEHDLLESGPYVARALPFDTSLASNASLAARAPHAALVGPLAGWLSSAWASARSWLLEQERSERDRHGGRSADFGDPDAIVGTLEAIVQQHLASISGARELRLEVAAGSDDLTVEIRAEMGTPARDASTTDGVDPLADVPADTPLAILVRGDSDERLSTARDLSATLAQIFGGRARDEDMRAIGTALDDWARARGDWMALGLTRGADGFWARTPARVDAASRAIREVLALSELPPLRAPLEQWLDRRPVAFAPPAGTTSLALFPPAGGGHPRQTVGVAWSTNVSMLTIGAGVRPLERLAEVTSPGSTWGDDARTARVLAGLGHAIRFAALAQPLRWRALQSASAPLGFAWGVCGDDPCVRVDLADELLATGVRLSADR